MYPTSGDIGLEIDIRPRCRFEYLALQCPSLHVRTDWGLVINTVMLKHSSLGSFAEIRTSDWHDCGVPHDSGPHVKR